MKQIDRPPIIELENIAKNLIFPHAINTIQDLERIAQKQRDADAEYYEGKYGKELDELKVQISDLNKRISGFREQLRQEVLKEVEARLSFTVKMEEKTITVDRVDWERFWWWLANEALKSGTMPEVKNEHSPRS